MEILQLNWNCTRHVLYARPCVHDWWVRTIFIHELWRIANERASLRASEFAIPYNKWIKIGPQSVGLDLLLFHSVRVLVLIISIRELQCDYSNRASWSKVDQSKIYLRTKDSILFSNKPIALKNTNNRSEQNWKSNKVRGVANLSGNFAVCWLVSLDPKFC